MLANAALAYENWVLKPISCISNYMRVLISIHLNTYQRCSAKSNQQRSWDYC